MAGDRDPLRVHTCLLSEACLRSPRMRARSYDRRDRAGERRGETKFPAGLSMSKRFPIPAFDYQRFKNMDWAPPEYLSREEQVEKIGAANAGVGDGFGGYPVQADEKFYERFKLCGEHQHAVMCVLPPR